MKCNELASSVIEIKKRIHSDYQQVSTVGTTTIKTVHTPCAYIYIYIYIYLYARRDQSYCSRSIHTYI